MRESIKISRDVKRKLDYIKKELGYTTYSDAINFLIMFYMNNRIIVDLEKFFKETSKVFKYKKIKI